MNAIYVGAAQFSRPSGKPGTREDEGAWGPFRKDYARLLHAPSFRRLQGKTQLYPGGQSDFFRNRLTHSLEVAQIARGLALTLNSAQVTSAFGYDASIDEGLLEFAGIAHDLGHPPFGHNGEHALDDLMLASGGFEGNAQTLRILTNVERKLVTTKSGRVTDHFGLDLTYRTLASVLKYDSCIPIERYPGAKLEKGYYASERKLVRDIREAVAPGLDPDAKFKTIECAIMDIADDIAYSTYDLEDSLHAGFYSPLKLLNEIVNNEIVQAEVIKKTDAALLVSGYSKISGMEEVIDSLDKIFSSFSPVHGKDSGSVKSKYKGLIDSVYAYNRDVRFLNDPLFRSGYTAERVGRLINGIELIKNKDYPALSGVRLGRPELLEVELLKHLNFELVIRSPLLSVVEHRGKDIVTSIFEALFKSEGALLPGDWRRRYEEARNAGAGGMRRVVCDFVACMTDRYAFELYGRLFGEDSTIFKPH
ncbi:dGTP triphosphohydrolase [Xanthomonas graminis]|uniref:dGTP triphosphohydrolase n=1 Tax=Xanthomonas graminis TaxID=3390026 RepID=UPI000839FD85|nr:dNTP triphosphohydrolase [Xanthomonas translucens]